MNWHVRALVNEGQQAYLPDTALNRMLNVAHHTTMLMLGVETNVDTVRLICTPGRMMYALDTNAIQGQVAAILRRRESISGGGDVAFIEVAVDQVGKVGEGAIPNSYAILGNQLILATPPVSTDTLFVVYLPRANNLATDTSAITLAREDQPAMLFLAAALASMRDKQLQAAGIFLGLYNAHIAAKRGVRGSAPTQ